jgi:hypothetical protein
MIRPAKFQITPQELALLCRAMEPIYQQVSEAEQGKCLGELLAGWVLIAEMYPKVRTVAERWWTTRQRYRPYSLTMPLSLALALYQNRHLLTNDVVARLDYHLKNKGIQ